MPPANSEPQDPPPAPSPPPAPPFAAPAAAPFGAAPAKRGYLPPAPVPDDGHVIPLRPLGLSELFTGAGRVLARAPRPVFGTALVAAAIAIGVQLAAGPAVTTKNRPDTSVHSTVHLAGVLASIADPLVTLIVMAVTSQVTLSLVAGTLPDQRQIYRRALRVLPLLLAVFLVRVITLAVLGLFVVGVFLFVMWSLTGYVLVAENARFVDAFRRSADLVRGSWWRVTGALVLLALITSGPSASAGSISIQIGGRNQSPWWVSVLVNGLVGIPLEAFAAAAVTLLYIDLRCRREGLAWKLDTARRGPQREPFGPQGVYATLPWQPTRR